MHSNSASVDEQSNRKPVMCVDHVVAHSGADGVKRHLLCKFGEYLEELVFVEGSSEGQRKSKSNSRRDRFRRSLG